MEIRTRKNQYQGINAHLNSYLLDVHGWNEFHGNHIAALTSSLKEQLLPLGYTAGAEESLQIWYSNNPPGRRYSDVTIYDPDPMRVSRPITASTTNTSELVLELPDVIAHVENYEFRAIAIYEFVPTRRDRGKPIAWIELLSPSNKVGSEGMAYQTKRQMLVEGGMVFVEIDYLHESPPTFDVVPPYPQPGSYPYRISVFEPRPDYFRGKTRIRQFYVDEPIPVVRIPLSGEDVLEFDFDIPYQRTFEDMLYGLEFVDYVQFPINFDRYSPTDQQRIAARMLAVIEAYERGDDLAAGGWPTSDKPLDELVQFIISRKVQNG